MEESSVAIEDFFGVYLLCSRSENPKFRGRTYIGYTVDPNRRIKQHNKGTHAGGAYKTSNRGPWVMVMIIHGFPNNISALRFEWAWQKPKTSRRLKEIPGLDRKRRGETSFHHQFRILSEMLRIGPWNRLPLVIRWLASDLLYDFEPEKVPPMHMAICYGRVIRKINKQKTKMSKTSSLKEVGLISDDEDVDDNELNDCDDEYSPSEKICWCILCNQTIDNIKQSKLTCLNPKCKLICHIICLAKLWLKRGEYVPIEGDCPICEKHVLWGDLIRKKNGCLDLIENDVNDVGNDLTFQSISDDDNGDDSDI